MNALPHFELVEATAIYVAKHARPQREPRELWTDGYKGLQEAIKHYRKGFGTKFRTFAIFCIKRHMVNGMHNDDHSRRLGYRSVLSLADMEDWQHPAAPEMQEEPELLTTLLGILKEQDRQIIALRLAGYESREIGERLGLTRTCVSQRIFRAATRMRQYAERMCA